MSQLEELHYFATPIYITKQPQFLDGVKALTAEKLKGKQPNKIYPALMTESLIDEPSISEFSKFVGEAAWNILSRQGYAMDGFSTAFTELWCQEHYYLSSMDYHVHGNNHLVGFYFLETPDDCPRALIHDPRPAKLMIQLPQADPEQATIASTIINFKPEPGMFLFAPAWLPHSFGRNQSQRPFSFVHFNIGVIPNDEPACKPKVEIV
jgi:uncharacterized protein (TIGR02466 family)